MSEMTGDNPAPAAARRGHAWLVLLAWLPAVLALGWCLWFRVGIPEPADWVFVRHEAPIPLRWGQVLEVEHGPAFLVFRSLYVGCLAIPKIGLQFGNLLPWLLALVAWLVSRRVVRMLAVSGGDSRWLWLVDLLLGLWMFHPAWGMNWLLAGRVREFMPVAAFGLALLSLNQRRSWSLCWCSALVWVAIAEASHVTGLLTWLAIGPAVYGAAQAQGIPRPLRSMLVFLGWAALVQVFVWQGFGVAPSAPGLVDFVVNDTSDVVSFLGRITSVGLPAVPPGIDRGQVVAYWIVCLVLVAVVLLRRRPLDAGAGALMSLTTYGAVVLVVVTDMAYRGQPGVGAQPLEFARESTVGAFTMLLGGYGLLRECVPRVFGALHMLFLGTFLVIFAWDWYASFEHLEMSRCLLRSQAAELVMEEAMPGRGVGRVPPPYSNMRASLLAPDDLQDLRERGLLTHLPKLPGTNLQDSYPMPGETSTICGEFRVRNGKKGTEFHAVLSGSLARPVPGLVLIARQRGDELRVIGVMRPRYDRGLSQVETDGVELPSDLYQPGDRLRAFGLEVLPLGLRSLRGEFEVKESGRVVALEGTRK